MAANWRGCDVACGLRATRDLLKSFGWGIATLHRLIQRRSCHPRRPPHSISPLEGTGFELLVRGRVRLVVGRRRQRNRTARRSRCRYASVTFDQLVPPTRVRRARKSLCSTVGKRIASRAPIHRSRDRAGIVIMKVPAQVRCNRVLALLRKPQLLARRNEAVLSRPS